MRNSYRRYRFRRSNTYNVSQPANVNGSLDEVIPTKTKLNKIKPYFDTSIRIVRSLIRVAEIVIVFWQLGLLLGIVK